MAFFTKKTLKELHRSIAKKSLEVNETIAVTIQYLNAIIITNKR